MDDIVIVPNFPQKRARIDQSKETNSTSSITKRTAKTRKQDTAEEENYTEDVDQYDNMKAAEMHII